MSGTGPEISRRQVLAGMTAAVGAAASMAGSRRSWARSAPLTIGALIPRTGGVDIIAGQMRLGLAAALDEINGAGGVFGRRLEVVERDSETRPPALPGLCRELVDKEGAMALIGPFAAAGRRWAAEPAAQLGVPLLFAANHEGTFCHPNLFALGPSTHQDIMPLIDHIDGGAGKTYFLVGSYPSWQHHMFRQCRLRIGKHGGKVRGQALMDTGETHYGPVARWIGETDARIALFCVPRESGRHFLHSLREAGLLDRLTVGWVGYNETHAAALHPEEASRVVTTSSFVSADPGPDARAFVARCRALGGRETPVTYYAYGHYTALMALYRAWQEAGEASAAAALAALPGLTIASPAGPVTIDPQTRHAARPIVVAGGRDLAIIRRLGVIAPEPGCG